MSPKAFLILNDGSFYQGDTFGASKPIYGEVVFNTSMTGYQEMLTDPSYAGQIVVLTYPMIGNYGINEQDFESKRVQVAGLVVLEHCAQPSHSSSTTTIHQFLSSHGVPGISGVDTRAITRRLRTEGVMMGMIAIDESPEASLTRLRESPDYGAVDFVSMVSSEKQYTWDQHVDTERPSSYRILVSDYGLKYNILRILHSKRCDVIAFPAATSAEEMMALKPDGIILSPGPGDPALLEYLVETAKQLIGRVPIMGICLGHQILGLALGGRTFKLKFGHRGANHPVQDLSTGLVHITAQNHGYALDGDRLPSDTTVSHIHLNDGTVEGLYHKSLPIISTQYHAEASPGPQENQYLFDQFLDMISRK